MNRATVIYPGNCRHIGLFSSRIIQNRKKQMNKFKSVLIVFALSYSVINAQLKLYGTAKPADLMIGYAKNISSVSLDGDNLQFDKNGFFVFGFDRDAKGTHTLILNYTNNKKETKTFNLPNRKYIIQRLKMADKYVNPPEEEMERIEKEAAEMKKARATIGIIDSALFSSGFDYPVRNPRRTSEFGSQRILNGVPKSPHNGIDFGADRGTDILAAADGVVAIAGDNFYYNGNFVLLDHGQGLTSVYLHMSKCIVKTGDRVKKGQKLGEVGTTGRSTAPHLHFGVQWYGKRIDPMSMINLKFPDKNHE